MKGRDAALDIARGIAIILVVWGHALIGVQRAMGPGEAGRFAIILLFCVHMPFFFFLSGMLSHSMTRLPPARFVSKLLGRVAYPYLLWSLVIVTIHLRMSGLTNTRVEGFELVELLYAPPAVMWFLYVLFFCFVLARTLVRTKPGTRLAIGIGLTLAGYFLDFWMLSHVRFIGMFLIGTLVSPNQALALARDRRAQGLACLCLAGPALLAWQVADLLPDGYPGLALGYLPAAFGGIVLILAIAQRLERWGAGALRVIGQRTMPIFVLHIVIVAGTRILLTRLGIGSPALVVGTAVVAGVALPMAAASMMERARLAVYLGWPRPEVRLR